MEHTRYKALHCGLLLLLSAAAARAQTTFSIGPQAGVGWATSRYVDAPYQYGRPRTAHRSGVTAGVLASFDRRHFALRPGVQFTQRGFVLENDYSVAAPLGRVTNVYHEEYRFNYLAVPVSLNYSQHLHGQGLQLFGGGYAAFLLGGTAKYDNHFDDTGATSTYQAEAQVRGGATVSADKTVFYTQRTDAGVHAGIGYGWRGLLLQGAYQFGLRNLGTAYATTNVPTPKYYNRSAEVSAVYFWCAKKR